jgi:hypothetical protein
MVLAVSWSEFPGSRALDRNAAMMREQRQYRASDYECTLIDRGRCSGILKRSSMLRSATIVLAILLALGSFGLSASAFARDGGYGAGIGVRGDNFGGGLGGASGDGYGGNGNRASGLRGEFRSSRGRDVWGRWGAYYGPMIPMI